MTTYDFNALMQQAQAEGLGPRAVLPDGTYTLQAQTVKVQQTQGNPKKDQIGVRWVVLDGPAAGQSTWENQTISPENPRAMGAFFGFCGRFGMDAAFFARQPQPSLAEVAANISDVVIVAEVGQRIWGKNNDKVDNTFKVVENRGKQAKITPQAATAAPGPVPGVPSVPATAPVVPVAAPVAQAAPIPAPIPQAAPAAVIPPAPVAVAPAPVAAAPAPVADPTQDPAYQAFLAQQAAAAPAPAPEAAPVAAPIDPATGLPAMPVRNF